MLPSDFHIYFYDSSGSRLNNSLGSETKPGPRLAGQAEGLGLQGGHPGTVSAVSGDGRWRVLLNPGPHGMSAVVALPLDTVDGATSKLLWLNAVLLAVTIVALIALGRWVVRLGLLPLTRMERTAQDVTAGRLDLRLADTDAHTEIGRLGRVLTPCWTVCRRRCWPERPRRPAFAGSLPTPGTSCALRSPPSRATPNSPFALNRVRPSNETRPTGSSRRTRNA